jgi:hypothetical protein
MWRLAGIDEVFVDGPQLFLSLSSRRKKVALKTRSRPFYLPSYSLTSDVLGFIRCGLQYRYQGVGKIPSTRPFQLWFGEFIHGVMEAGFREYRESVVAAKPGPPPWGPFRIIRIGKQIERALRDRKIFPNNKAVRQLGYLRALKAINDLGPHLFPLIAEAEVPLSTTRPMLRIWAQYKTREITAYELTGRIDVITSVTLRNPSHASNKLVQYILGFLTQEVAQRRMSVLPQNFEIIVDYKGSRRPAVTGLGAGKTDYWRIYGWQLRTYAHIRDKQPGSLPVVLGIVVYLNELLPTWDDLLLLRADLAAHRTDVIPTPGSQDWAIIQMPTPRRRNRNFKRNRGISWDLRMRRALRLEPVYPMDVAQSMDRFDRYVRQIEVSHSKENQSSSILASWPKNTSDQTETCTACDYQTFCPRYKGGLVLPPLPSV